MTRYETRTTDNRAEYFRRSAEDRAANPDVWAFRVAKGQRVQARLHVAKVRSSAKVLMLRRVVR